MADRKIIDLERLQQFLSKCDARYIRFGKKVYDGTLGAGTSDLAGNFDTKMVYNDNLAYNFRTTAGGEEVANQIKQKAIVGGSLGWNQTTKQTYVSHDYSFDGAIAESGYYYANLGSSDIFDAPIAGHKYLLRVNASNYSNNFYGFRAYFGGYGNSLTATPTNPTREAIISATGPEILARGLATAQSTVTFTGKLNTIDLTACFGSTIADYIYSLEQATAGAGVAWFRRYFPKPYYPYHAIGGFAHVQTKGKKYVKFNQWDEQWELGQYGTDGQPVSDSNSIRSKSTDPIRVLPNTTYKITKYGDNSNLLVVYFYDADDNFIPYTGTGSYNNAFNTVGGIFTTPSNCEYIRFRCSGAYGTTYKHDICINLHWDGERDGEYEAYKENVYDVDPIELMGIPKIDAQGNLYFDGDIYPSDGNVTGRFGIVDLGMLDWNASSYEGNDYFYTTELADVLVRNTDNLSCGIYSSTTSFGTFLSSNMIMLSFANGNFGIRNTSYTDAATFKTAMSGIYLIYELATPTTSEAASYTELQIGDNWGTEEFLPPDDDTRPVEVPVGNDTEYLPDLKAKLETAPANPDTDGDYVMHRESGENSYIPLATWLLANGYPQANVLASKDALGGTLRQLLAATKSIDFANTDFVDLGELSYTYAALAGGRYCFSVAIFGLKYVTSGVPNLMCSKYQAYDFDNIYNVSGVIGITTATNGPTLLIYDSNYTDVAAFKAAMKGVLLAYEKAE